MTSKHTQETFSDGNAKSVTAPSIPTGTRVTHVLIGVETAGIYFTQDNSTPASTNGQAMAAGEKLYLTDDIDRLKIIRQASGAIVNLTWYYS